MNIRLLKIREMKRFCKWVQITSPAHLDQYSTMAEFNRADQASHKVNFFWNRGKGNYSWPPGRNSRTCSSKLDMYSFGSKMEKYIEKRQERKRKKPLKKPTFTVLNDAEVKEMFNSFEKKYEEEQTLIEKIPKKTIRSKDGKRTVGMYPESCREITFVYDDHHKERDSYGWPEDSHLLLSPSRILDGTKDKSGLEAWRKRVGEEEADRITNEGLSIGKSLHTYLENSIWKFCNVKYQNHPPLVNPSSHPHAALAANMGNIILEKGLKDRLEWVYGLEAYIFYSIYYRGIIDLVGTYEGELCIIDFKTKKEMPKEEWTEDWKMQVVAYGMAHNFRCKTHIKKGVILLVTRELEFDRIIIEGDEWNKYYKMFCRKLRDFIVIDRDAKEKAYRYAHNRYKEIQKTIKDIK